MYDVAVIGSGPAGLSAALYLKRAGKLVHLLKNLDYQKKKSGREGEFLTVLIAMVLCTKGKMWQSLEEEIPH